MLLDLQTKSKQDSFEKMVAVPEKVVNYNVIT